MALNLGIDLWARALARSRRAAAAVGSRRVLRRPSVGARREKSTPRPRLQKAGHQRYVREGSTDAPDDSGAEGANGGTIGRRGQTESARRQRDHGHRVAGHVEELNRVAFLGEARNGVALHDRPDIAQALLDGVVVAGPRQRNHPDFPLRSFVRCEVCGRPLTGSWSKGRNCHYAYYHCQRQCRAVNVSKATLERAFVELALLQPTRLATCGWADPIRAQSAIDRITSNAYDLVIYGESYRSRLKPTLARERRPSDRMSVIWLRE
jgi:hypothetical protein